MKFTKEHEWAELEGGVVKAGITDYAAKSLGDIVSIELPKVGAHFRQGAPLAIVDSMKASSDVYAPASGTVVEVNSALEGNPQWVNEEPLGKGWMVKLKPDDAGELNSLMDEGAYRKYTEGLKH